MKIVNDKIVIENEEELNALNKILEQKVSDNPLLLEALKNYNETVSDSIKDFPLFNSVITKDMNTNPWRYASHCLKEDVSSIFMYLDGEQYLYIENQWQRSSVFGGILKEIDVEIHKDAGEEWYVSRKDIKRYQEVYENKGLDFLKDYYINLCNSNSMGSLPNIVAIQVVLRNNNLSFDS